MCGMLVHLSTVKLGGQGHRSKFKVTRVKQELSNCREWDDPPSLKLLLLRYIRLTAFSPGQPSWVSRHQKGQPFWILLDQEMMGWQWDQVEW